jgi:hypothetical protein
MISTTEFDRENEAAWIISTVLSGLPYRLDYRSKGGKTMECDFEIYLPSGLRVALEITSSTVRNRAQQLKLIGGGAWDCPGIKRNWSVQLDGAGPRKAGTRIDTFKSQAGSFFVTLEKECPYGAGDLLNADFSIELSRTAQMAIAGLNELGARHGSLLEKPPYGFPRIYLGWTYEGASDDPSLNEVVEKAALSNREKLEQQSDCERHLFVWIDQTDYRNWADLFTFQFTNDTPHLPESISQVWVGPWSPGINYDGSLQSLLSSNGTDPWIRHVGPRVSEYYERNRGKSPVMLKHLTDGVHPFGTAKPWRSVQTDG